MKDIVFDFGGVLIDWNPRHLYKKVFASEEEMEWFLTQVCSPAWNGEQDAGRPFAEGVKLLLEKYPKYAAQIEDFYRRWPEMLSGPVKGTADVLKELKDKGYRVYGLTNWSAETFPLAWERFEFLHWLDGIVVSGEEKCIKPDARLYQTLLSRFNLSAQNCVFIDDNPHNTAAARALGFETVDFADAVQLRKELVSRQIL